MVGPIVQRTLIQFDVQKTNKTANDLAMIRGTSISEKIRELLLLELKNIRRSRVEMDFIPAVLFESFFIFPNFYDELLLESVVN